MYPMNEGRMAVRARKADYDLTKKAIDEAVKVYKSETGKDVKVLLDEDNPLPAGS